jgi:hypothetical protein
MHAFEVRMFTYLGWHFLGEASWDALGVVREGLADADEGAAQDSNQEDVTCQESEHFRRRLPLLVAHGGVPFKARQEEEDAGDHVQDGCQQKRRKVALHHGAHCRTATGQAPVQQQFHELPGAWKRLVQIRGGGGGGRTWPGRCRR